MKVGTVEIKISNPAKVLFPEDGITKAELLEYSRQIGAMMLEHIRDRPLMLQRFPDGILREGFIQQQIPADPIAQGLKLKEGRASPSGDNRQDHDSGGLGYYGYLMPRRFHEPARLGGSVREGRCLDR